MILELSKGEQLLRWSNMLICWVCRINKNIEVQGLSLQLCLRVFNSGLAEKGRKYTPVVLGCINNFIFVSSAQQKQQTALTEQNIT